jgi:hypothetical protein
VLFKEMVAVAKLIQATVEHHYGLYGKLRVRALLPSDEEEDLAQSETVSCNCGRAYCALYKELGIGLFGAHVVLYSPRGKPLGVVAISWRFQVDDDGFRPREGTREAVSFPQEYWIPCPGVAMIRPETNISRVEVAIAVGTTCCLEEDTTDLRVSIRQKLKENYDQVRFNMGGLEADRQRHWGFSPDGKGGAMSAGYPWW